MGDKKRIIAYYIHKNFLPLATKLMTSYEHGHFESKIIDVIKMSNKSCAFDDEEEIIIVLEVNGESSFMINEWEKKLKVTQDIIGERDKI